MGEFNCWVGMVEIIYNSIGGPSQMHRMSSMYLNHSMGFFV